VPQCIFSRLEFSLAFEETNLNIGVIQNFIQINTPSDVEIYVVKGYILIAQVVDAPSCSAGINVTPMPLPQPYMSQNFWSFQKSPTGILVH
jgi:hypothetical protein